MNHNHKTYLLFLFSILFLLLLPQNRVSAASDVGKIHFLTLPNNTDAILLECNGKFGMVDSGEDTDYPSGKDSRYPLRNGIVTTWGYEKDVISYMKSVGVTKSNFEFYIGTHPHSDHIGSADEIINEFQPKRVYIEPYSDSDITDSSRLWDNLYVYDHMITAAKNNGATLIQTFKEGAPLYPETVTIKGTIIWQCNENQDENHSDPDDSVDEDNDANIDNNDNGDNEDSTDNVDNNDNGDNNGNMDNNDDGNNSNDEDNSDSQNAGTSSPPEDITITLSYHTNDSDTTVPSSVTLSTTDGSIKKLNDTTWTYEFSGVFKYDNSKTAYSYSITPEASGYQFQPVNPDLDPGFDFICTHADSNISQESFLNLSDNEQFDSLSDSGISDEALASDPNGTTDALTTSNIRSCDLVDPNNSADPNNMLADPSAAPGQSGIYEGQVGASSSPSFYLGGKDGLLIEIMNYGVARPQTDANNFSLGVKVTSVKTGKTAFLAGDINNYIGAETRLAQKLGHVDVLKLGHHGSYGSNTPTYINTLSPYIAILTGTYEYVTNASFNGESGPFDTLLNMSSNRTRLYATAWYHTDIKSIVVNLNSQLTNNIPANKYVVASSMSDTTPVLYYNGHPTQYYGWIKNYNNTWYYFENSYLASYNKWLNLSGTYYYLDQYGRMATGWVPYNGNWYYMNENGHMTTGWQKINGKYYYMDSEGRMLTGRQRIDNVYYYFFSDGAMASDQYGDDGEYYDVSGKWSPSFVDSNWMQNSSGWWYRFGDGSYPYNTWLSIHGKWYYFYPSGYMASGWLKQDGDWYYLGTDGAMRTGWQKVSSIWYYLDTSGKMLTGFQRIGGSIYCFNNSGAMLTGWQYLNNNWYYFSESGAASCGWYRVNGTWYYSDTSGKMLTGWICPDGNYYYLTSSGAMAVGWIYIGGNWYYMNPSGSMAIGWKYINNTWYYMNNSGKMLTGLQKINGQLYYLNPSGAMVTGWAYIGQDWYYFNPSGAAAAQGWIQLKGSWYYLNPSSGKMAANTWTPDGYYVSASGAWTGQRR